MSTATDDISAGAEDPALIKPGQRYATTAQVARRVAHGERWVRARAAQLGGCKESDRPNAPLRFNLDQVDAYMESLRLAETHRRRRPPTGRQKQPTPPPTQKPGREWV